MSVFLTIMPNKIAKMGDLYSLVDLEKMCGYIITLPNKMWQK